MFCMVDEYHTAPIKHSVNFKDLNRLLKLEIFLHKDGQLRAAHVILEYKPSTKHFQSPKNVIKARDQRLALIDAVVPEFLLSKPPLEGTQDAQLPAPLVAKLLYSLKPPIPSDDEAKDPFPKHAIQDITENDFEVFYRQEDPVNAPRSSRRHPQTTQVSTIQGATDIPEGMGYEEKTPNLMTLLNAHAEGNILEVAVVPHTPTPSATRTSSMEATEKKRKRAQGSKGIEGAKEGEVIEIPHQPPLRMPVLEEGNKEIPYPQGPLKTLRGTSLGSPPSEGFPSPLALAIPSLMTLI